MSVAVFLVWSRLRSQKKFFLGWLYFGFGLEHLHQCSICDTALEVLDEVHHSNPVKNPLEETTHYYWGSLWKKQCTAFQSPWKRRESNKTSSNRIDLTAVPVPVLVLWVELAKKQVT